MNARFAVVVAVLMAMAAVAVEAKAPTPSRSVALKTALALELTDAKDGPLRDLSRAELPAELRDVPDPTVGNAVRKALVIGSTVSAARHAGYALPGISFGAIAGIGAFVSLFGSEKMEHPATQRHFMAYVPRSVGDKQAAMNLVNSTMEDLLVRAYQSQGYEVTITEKRWKGLFGGDGYERLIALKGGDVCGKTHGCRLVLSASSAPKLVDKAPSVIPKSESGYYVWKNWRWGDKGYDYTYGNYAGVAATGLDAPDELKFRVKVPQISREIVIAASALMPDWMLVYEPASKSVPYPAFFYRGEEKLFVEPLGAGVATPQPIKPPPESTPPTHRLTVTPGALVVVRDGAPLRGNPTAQGAVLRTLTATAAVELATRMTNSFGAWWSVKVDGKTGWLSEADITASSHDTSAAGEIQ